jgi:hypothetical protein
MEVGIAEVVERPATRDDHRVGVSAAQHPDVAVDTLGIPVEPEHQVLGPHPVRDRCGIGTSRPFAEAFHRERD